MGECVYLLLHWLMQKFQLWKFLILNAQQKYKRIYFILIWKVENMLFFVGDKI